ncbi:MAG: multicopper oxidase domain-containing protein [Verrucomicrobiota bacterium]
MSQKLSMIVKWFLALQISFLVAVPALGCDWCVQRQPAPNQHVVEYDLTIDEELVSPAGKSVHGFTINGGIPGPTLRFREGDFARIRVHNNLKRETTSTHWHGLLLPNDQDGVPHITTPPILPGQTHTFGFTLKHSGTYWYHSHTHLQEQNGIFGSIVVTPKDGEPVQADRDEVLLFSDWTNIDPMEVMRMLMRGSDYFGLLRRNSQSILGAWKSNHLKDYFQREWDRMPPMDLSDVGYHGFLVNGQREVKIAGRPGEKIRLRLINASAATYLYIQSSAGPMTIVAADGPAVEPVQVDRFLMAIAETYDVLVTVPGSGQVELRGTAQDGSGHASAYFGSGKRTPVNDPPKANTYEMDEMLNLVLEEREKDTRASLNLPRPGSPYRVLRSRKDTALPAQLPRRKITLHLTGDMSRYIWSFDGKTVAQEPYVKIKRGEIIELELVNDTMMHHPIHLHGHFFRLLMGQGNRSPLKHTVDVPPMGKRTLEFEANEAKDWMFHCHILYHMMSGMARVFRYEDEPAQSDKAAKVPPASASAPESVSSHGDKASFAGSGAMHKGGGLGEHNHDMSYTWATASLQSHMSEGSIVWMNPKNDLLANWEIGWRGVEKTRYEVDTLYQRYVNANFQPFAGGRFTNDPEAKDRIVAGFNYRLPLLFMASVSIDSERDARFSLAKRFQLTPRLGVWGRGEYDTNTMWKWTSGLDVTLSRNTSFVAQYHSEFGLGAGFQIRF